jgi:hypothetical protein
MQDTGLWEKFVSQFRHPFPHHVRSLAAPAKLPVPQDNDMIAKRM